MQSLIKITPAPGYVLVAPDNKPDSIGDVQLAVQKMEYHEGTVLEIGPIPDQFKSMDLMVGDKVIFARYSAVEAMLPGSDTKARLVGLHDIKGYRKSGSWHKRILRKLKTLLP